MQINFNAEMKTIEGEIIKDGEGGPSLTLKTICVRALQLQFDDERNLPGDKKAERFVLATKIYGGETDFEVEQIASLKSVLGKAYGPLFVGQAFALLR